MTSTKKGIKSKLNYKHTCDLERCSVQCLTKFINPKTKYFQNPYPIIQGIDIKYDPVLELVRKKQDYQLKIETMKNIYRKHQRKLKIDKQFECYKNMQDLLAQDPDKYFYSNYNWYYTNGNLIIQSLQNIPFIFYTNNLTNLCVSELHKTNADWFIKKKDILCNHNSDIYQLDSVNVLAKSFLGVREKKEMLIYDVKVSDNKQVTCKLVSSQSANIPFVAMSLNKVNIGEYVTIDANQTVTFYDLSKEKKMCEYTVPHDIDDLEGDCFAQLAYVNNNDILMCVNRTTLFILDKRSNKICTKYHVKNNDILELYDRFANICPCQTNTCYISTFRESLLFELRFNKVLSKYSHNFSSAPLLTDVMNNTDKSLVCLSSSKPNEKMILEKENTLNLIPVCLPTITNSYESSLHSTNISLSLNMKQRLDASTTGMRLWCDENNRFVVFSTNILGDVYCYILDKPKELSNRRLHNWNILFSDHCNDNQLNFVDKIVLNDVDFKQNSKPISLTSVIKNKRILECVQDLKNSKKGYNMKICDAWENVKKTNMNVLDDMEEVPTNVTVQNWLSHYCP